MSRSKKGFTIVELVVVIAVVAILAAVLIPSFSSLNKKAKDSAYLQERTNQQIADLAEKVENQKFLSWEDLESKLAEELAKIETVDEASVTDAIAKAIAKFENSLKTDDTALTEAQVKAIVEKALEGQLTTAQVEAIVNAAVDSIELPEVKETVTPDQIKAIIDNAVAGLDKQTGITADEMKDAITAAMNAQTTLTPDQVTTIVNNALAGFGYGNDPSISDIQSIIEAAMGKVPATADDQAAAEMTAIVANAGDNFEAAVTALSAAGYNVGALKPIRTGYTFCWTAGEVKCVKTEDKGTMKEILGEGASFIKVTASTSEEAAEALEYGCDVTLAADVALVKTVDVKGDVTIDLNGFDLDASANANRLFNLTGDATLTINAEGSTIKCGIYGLFNCDTNTTNATIVVNGGTYTADLDNGAFIKPRGNGTFDITLNNVNYTDNSDDSYIMNTKACTGSVNLTVNGGTFDAAFGFQAGDDTKINGATITTDGFAVEASKNSAITNCTITTGTIKETGIPAIAVAAVNKEGCNVTVSNCTINAGLYAYGTMGENAKLTATNNTLTGATENFRNGGTLTAE